MEYLLCIFWQFQTCKKCLLDISTFNSPLHSPWYPNMSPFPLDTPHLFVWTIEYIIIGSWNIDWRCWCDLVQVTIAALSSWVPWPCYLWKTAFHSTPLHPAVLAFFLPHLCDLPWALWWGGGLGIDVPLKPSTQSHSFSALCPGMNFCWPAERSVSNPDCGQHNPWV